MTEPRAGALYRLVPKLPDRVAIEQDVLARWESEHVFARLREQTSGGEPYSFLDGPITANNPMGVHHAWGRTLKDIIQRYQAMNGRQLRWQGGFDCQGLWVEVEVEKALGFDSQARDRGVRAGPVRAGVPGPGGDLRPDHRPVGPAGLCGWTGTAPTTR